MHSPVPSTLSASAQSIYYDGSVSSSSPHHDLSNTSLGTASSMTLHTAEDFYLKNAFDDRTSSPILPTCLNHKNNDLEVINRLPSSSTPDLRSHSRSSSSSCLSGSDSQFLKTPPEDSFISSLNRKLEELLKEGRLLDERKRPRYNDYTSGCSTEVMTRNPSYSQEPAPRIDDFLASKHKTGHAQKRKRNGSASSHDAELESDASISDGKRKKIDPSSDQSMKKLKRTSFSYTTSETASARRAHGLSANASFVSASADLVSTVPVSPLSWSTANNSHHKLLPIIPMPDFSSIPRPPYNADDAAERRLRIMLRKEEERRLTDGFKIGVNFIFDKKITQEEMNSFLGIDEAFRRNVIQWMLYVTPSKKLRVGHLRDQLRSSPETRFHAILLFNRYFMRVGDAMPSATAKETPLMRLGRQRIIWDVAVSCLALAVKFHRDFLEPLTPILSKDFLIIAPHPMSHDDFELSQKDVLQALDYRICDVTPDSFMEEIWNSLSTLRKVLHFTDGWEVAKMNAWHRLNVATTVGEMLQFPMSLLSSAALIEGSIEALVAFHESDLESRVGRELTEDENENLEDTATKAFANVIEDIKDIMDIDTNDLKDCRSFLQRAMEST